MNIYERQNLIAKIIADLELLIKMSWQGSLQDELREAWNILKQNERLEGYDD